MQIFLEKFRKISRKIFLFLGVSAVSLVFQACYGMPPDDYPYDEDSTETECEDGSSEENPQ